MRSLVVAGLASILAARIAAAGEAWHPLAAGGGADASHPIARIYNGTPTTDYPAVGGIVLRTADDRVALCTGTLITSTVVATAAHCFDLNPVQAVGVFFPDGATEQDVAAVAYIVHPDYSPDALAYADIALLALDSPVGVTPVPVATATPRSKRTGVIVGFGQDEVGNIGLKEAGTIRLRRCPKKFGAAGIARGQLATSLCWHPKKRGQDTCHGDSGGPLLVDGALAGVTSGGYPDCPGVLSWDTNVALFGDWIAAALGP